MQQHIEESSHKVTLPLLTIICQPATFLLVETLLYYRYLSLAYMPPSLSFRHPNCSKNKNIYKRLFLQHLRRTTAPHNNSSANTQSQLVPVKVIVLPGPYLKSVPDMFWIIFDIALLTFWLFDSGSCVKKHVKRSSSSFERNWDVCRCMPNMFQRSTSSDHPQS